MGYVFYRNPFKTLLLLFVLIVGLSSQIPKITVDTSTEGVLHKDDEGLMAYNAYRDQFSGSSIVLIGIRSSNVFTPEFLTTLESFHKDLEREVPHLNKVTSLINIRDTRGEEDVLYVDGLLHDWQNKEIDYAALKQRVLGNDFYLNSIISEDGGLVAIVIETDASVPISDDRDDLLDAFEDDSNMEEKPSQKVRYFSEKDNRKVIDAIDSVVKRYQDPEFSISLTGRPIVVNTFNVALRKDTRFLLIIASIMVAIFLILLFRRLSGIILPFIPVICALVSTLGLMAIFGDPMTLFSSILPAFLMAVGVAGSIHIIAIFYRRIEQGDDKETSICNALVHSGLAVLLTSLTTAAGLLSFSFSELAALGDLGIYSAVGVMLAFFYTIVMFPAIIALIPIKILKKPGRRRHMAIMDRVLLFFADFSTSHPKKIFAASLMLFVISVFGVLRLEFSHNVLRHFPDSMPIKVDTLMVDKELKGTLVLRVVVDTGEEDGLYEPGILNGIETFIHDIEKIRQEELFVGKVISINNILKETNQALNENDPSYYTIPESRAMIAQEFMLFENTGSDDFEQIVDSRRSKTSITVKIPFVDYDIIDEFMSAITLRFDKVFKDGADITITGIPALMGRTIPLAQRSMALSYAIAFCVITIMMIFLLGSVKFGLICMVPNLLPVLIIMGFMGHAGVAVDMSALMIGSIAIGLVVDDTMHFMYNFRKYYGASGDVYPAIRETMLGTGRALLITSLVLCSFFFSTMLGILNNTFIFGLYTGQVIIVALLADFILLPALLSVMLGKK